MLTEERKHLILRLLEAEGIVKSQALIQELDASESTIRRDLQELEDAGRLVRIHGGAKQIQNLADEPHMSEKTVKNVQEKSLIAQLAVEEIHDDDVIYLDAGSTTLEMLPFLKNKNIKVVTNSVLHAAQLVEANIKTIILGGEIKLSTDAVLGNSAIQQLQGFHINKAFVGTNGLTEAGFTTPDIEEAALKQTAIQQSERAFIIADHSKFQKVSFAKFAEISEATIITDYCPKEYLTALKALTTIKEAK